MNKIFNILFLMISIVAHSQSYKPLLDDYNEWRVTHCSTGCVTDTYYTDGDTTVSGMDYKILDGFHYIMRTGLIREDVPNKKVYIMGGSHGPEEFLMYDFSMNIGDSIELHNRMTPFETEPGYFTLDSIVLKPLVDGNNYRHFFLSANDPTQAQTTGAVWVEGVGSQSLISGPGSLPNINAVGQLSCFYKNEDLFYAQNDSIPDCPLQIDNASLLEKTGPEVHVSPTIVSTTVTVQSDQIIDRIEIINILKLISNFI